MVFDKIKQGTKEMMLRYGEHLDNMQRNKNQRSEIERWDNWVKDHYQSIMTKLREQVIQKEELEDLELKKQYKITEENEEYEN